MAFFPRPVIRHRVATRSSAAGRLTEQTFRRNSPLPRIVSEVINAHVVTGHGEVFTHKRVWAPEGNPTNTAIFCVRLTLYSQLRRDFVLGGSSVPGWTWG